MNTSLRAVQGGTQLLFDSVDGITNTVERMHETIARAPLPWGPQPTELTRAHGIIASTVYSIIRGVNGVIRQGVERSLGLVPEIESVNTRPRAEILAIAALNGVLGDHLESTNNSLAIPMSFMTPDQTLQLTREALAQSMPQASPHVLILAHGLSMSELCWQRSQAPCIGSKLQQKLGYTPVYLRYNTGRHISTNGQELTELLETLCENWPVPVKSVSLIGHSMGGLVIRSACWYAQQNENAWIAKLKRAVYLGTPHHGSPLERAGHTLDKAMQKVAYLEPLAFARKRSAGIKDLRHGNLLDEDWQGHHPDQHSEDSRTVVPLLPKVDHYFAAATMGENEDDPLGHFLGDMLVRLDSATGTHSDDLRALKINPKHCRVFHETNHINLLDDEKVQRQIVKWFKGS